MIRLEWNALRIGHPVLVHDDTDRDLTLLRGTVTATETASEPVGMAIRVTRADGASSVVRPRRLAVHLAPLDPAEDCWRCAISRRGPRESHPSDAMAGLTNEPRDDRNDHA